MGIGGRSGKYSLTDGTCGSWGRDGILEVTFILTSAHVGTVGSLGLGIEIFGTVILLIASLILYPRPGPAGFSFFFSSSEMLFSSSPAFSSSSSFLFSSRSSFSGCLVSSCSSSLSDDFCLPWVFCLFSSSFFLPADFLEEISALEGLSFSIVFVIC